MCEEPESQAVVAVGGGSEGDETEGGEGREREKVMKLFAAVQVAFSEDSDRKEVLQ